MRIWTISRVREYWTVVIVAVKVPIMMGLRVGSVIVMRCRLVWLIVVVSIVVGICGILSLVAFVVTVRIVYICYRVL